MGRLRRFLHLPPNERRLVLAALCCVAGARLAVLDLDAGGRRLFLDLDDRGRGLDVPDVGLAANDAAACWMKKRKR